MDDVRLRIAGLQVLSVAVIESVNRACEQVEDARGDSALVIHLPGRGGDAACWPYDVDTAVITRWERALRRLERLPAPTIAVADGLCYGVALEALLVTDYRIGSQDVRLRIAARGGVTWPSMVIHRLANQIGVARARSLVLHGTEMPASEAQACGLLDLVADDPSRAGADFLTGQQRPGRELAVRRQLLLESPSTSYDDALGAHLAACDRARRAASALLSA